MKKLNTCKAEIGMTMENDRYKELKEAWAIFEREIWTVQPFKTILKLAEKILDWLEKRLKKRPPEGEE